MAKATPPTYDLLVSMEENTVDEAAQRSHSSYYRFLYYQHKSLEELLGRTYLIHILTIVLPAIPIFHLYVVRLKYQDINVDLYTCWLFLSLIPLAFTQIRNIHVATLWTLFISISVLIVTLHTIISWDARGLYAPKAGPTPTPPKHPTTSTHRLL